MKTRKVIMTAMAGALLLSVSAACTKEEQQSQLASPVPEISAVTGDGFTVSWSAVENATAYVYVLGTESQQSTSETSVTFTGLAAGDYTVQVKATGSGYLDSEWAEITATVGDEGGVSENVVLAMQTEYVADGSFNINFSPGEGVTSIRYAVVSAVEQSISESQAAFESGTLDNIAEISADETVVEIRDGGIGPYAVFARGITDSGAQSPTQYSQIMAFSAGFTVDNFDLVAMDYTATVHSEELAYTGLLVVSKSVLEELGYTIDELTEMYASFSMIEMVSDGTSAMAELNGYENYEYVIGVVGFDASGTPSVYGSFEMQTGFADESLPLPGELTISVSEVTESSARVQYTMGENTRLYYQSVMTLSDYNSLLSYGTSYGYSDPEEYVRDYVAVYGYSMFTDDDYVWDYLSPGTEYIALGYPMNGNGTLGYGATAKQEFTTSGSSSSSVKSSSTHTKSGVRTIRPVTVEQVRELLSK